MTKEDFNLINDINVKAQLVWDVGSYLDERVIYKKAIVKIYCIYNFFVEVHMDVKKLGITKINALENETGRQSYLDSIRLEKFL